MAAQAHTIVESLAQMSLFADLTAPQLEEVAHTVGEEEAPARHPWAAALTYAGYGLLLMLLGLWLARRRHQAEPV